MNRIKTLREEFGYTQQDLADRLDGAKSTIAMYENETRKPSLEVLIKLSKIFDCSIDYILDKSDVRNPETTLEDIVYDIYNNLKKFANNISNHDKNTHYMTGDSIETFQEYLKDLILTLEYKNNEEIHLDNYYQKDFLIEDYAYISGFLYLYDSFLKNLTINNYTTIIDYKFIDWFNINEIYNNINNLKNLTLFSYNSSNIIRKEQNLGVFIEYIEEFSKCLNLSFLSDFDNNALTEIFKNKINTTNNSTHKPSKNLENLTNQSTQFYMTPVYGQISAGQPNWAEECIDGYLPIDPNLMNIVNPDECFFLKVNGESMNKIIRNGAYALIRKTDFVENGEIAVVLVNRK